MPVLWVGEEGVHARNPLVVAEFLLSREACDRFTERKDSNYEHEDDNRIMFPTDVEDTTGGPHSYRTRWLTEGTDSHTRHKAMRIHVDYLSEMLLTMAAYSCIMS